MRTFGLYNCLNFSQFLAKFHQFNGSDHLQAVPGTAYRTAYLVPLTVPGTAYRYRLPWYRLPKATLSAQQFIDRLLLHILPKGWQKVRYYGFWNSTQKKKLKRIIHLLGALHLKDPKNEEKQLICPVCLRGEMCFLKTVLSQKWRAPP